MLFFPLAIQTDVCSFQINYKTWRKEFCSVLLPCKKVPAADFYCVYFYCSGTRGKEDGEQLGFVGDNGLFLQHICSPLAFPLTSQWAISFACPHVFFIGSREKINAFFLMSVSIFLLPTFTTLEWELYHNSLKCLQTDWISCNICGWCLL